MADISVKVQYLGILRNALGCLEERLVVPTGASVGDVLRLLREKHGEQFTSIMFRGDGGLRPLARVLVNGQNIRDAAGVETRLEHLGRRPLFAGLQGPRPVEPQPDHTGWDRSVDEAWARRERPVLSGPWAANAAARVLGSPRLRDSLYRTLQGLLDASPYLKSRWSRDRNTIVRGSYEMALTFGINQVSGG